MKSHNYQSAVDSMIHELVDWSVQLNNIEKQLDQHQTLSHDCTVQLSWIINQLDELNMNLEDSNFLDDELLISCFANCVLKLKNVYDKLYKESNSMLLKIMVDNTHHDYKLEKITETDLYLN